MSWELRWGLGRLPRLRKHAVPAEQTYRASSSGQLKIRLWDLRGGGGGGSRVPREPNTL